ncbi:MAG: hypothetical protein KGH63_04860 [Candidatus Micrarchaeota archaeon]|nr:hypothetical protein [Candidatus Micrarchaeota archaeon]
MKLFFSPQPAPAPASPKPRLEVFCSMLEGASLERLEHSFARRISLIRSRAQRRGAALPTVMLLAEDALSYRYQIQSEEVASWADRLRRLLPADQWIALAFCVREKLNGHPSNTAYALSSDGVEMGPKRALTRLDVRTLDRRRPVREEQQEFWIDRGLRLEGRPYPQLLTPDGLKLEIRVCADAVCPPHKRDAADGTLVMARGLNPLALPKLAARRRFVLVHDAHPPASPAAPAALLEKVWFSNGSADLPPAFRQAGVRLYSPGPSPGAADGGQIKAYKHLVAQTNP